MPYNKQLTNRALWGPYCHNQGPIFPSTALALGFLCGCDGCCIDKLLFHTSSAVSFLCQAMYILMSNWVHLYIKKGKIRFWSADPVESGTTCDFTCSVLMRSPSWSILFSDVSMANGAEMPRQEQNAHVCVAFWNSRCHRCCKQQEIMFFKKTLPSSETQEQIVGAGESLNGWEKNGSKKSSRHLFSAI